MDNKEFTQILFDAKEHLNQLSTMVKDNIKAEELILDNLLNSPLNPLSEKNDMIQFKHLGAGELNPDI